MRQRTISDYFWRDPDISDLSQEDKATLLYFLTSPSSNIIGVYQIVWMIAAAEMGWTKDQLLVVVKRLQIKGLIDFNDAGWIWVKIWWKHNSAAGAFSPKLIQNAKKQCAAMPPDWSDEFLKTLGLAEVNRVSIGYQYPIYTPPPNTTCISNSTTTTTNDLHGYAMLEFPRELNIKEKNAIAGSIHQVHYLPLEQQQELLDELAKAIRTNSIKVGKVPFFRGLVNAAQQGKFVPTGGLTVLASRNKAAAKSQVKMDIDPAVCAKGAIIIANAREKRLDKQAHDGQQASASTPI